MCRFGYRPSSVLEKGPTSCGERYVGQCGDPSVPCGPADLVNVLAGPAQALLAVLRQVPWDASTLNWMRGVGLPPTCKLAGVLAARVGTGPGAT